MEMEENKNKEDLSIELSARRTGMSFQRTRLSADRTLMSVIRTSLSLITFGFTIFQFFEKVKNAVLVNASAVPPARNFGIALVALGIGMLILGIIYHIQFMVALRLMRKKMKAEHLIYGKSPFPISLTLIVAIFLLIIGVSAIFSMLYQTGPFG